ncbi:unnamed protein product [Penicillium salamii]|nr:unnamed protein product [Penicillium salamii]CAG8401445.1 unnamed protein product [Penicillium salamii]
MDTKHRARVALPTQQHTPTQNSSTLLFSCFWAFFWRTLLFFAALFIPSGLYWIGIFFELNDHLVKMSVRVVARVRPLLNTERDLDVILRTGSSAPTDSKSRLSSIGDKTDKTDKKLASLRDRDNVVRIPNPKNEGEEYAFQFNGVYAAEVSQQELFDAEGE